MTDKALATNPAAFSAAPMGALGFYGVQLDKTGSWVAAWDGTPAKWQTKEAAEADAVRISNRERPLQCLAPVADSGWWRS